MARAIVYCRWENQGGPTGQGGWSYMAEASAQGNTGIVALNAHAERKAWAVAWGPNNSGSGPVRGYLAGTIDKFKGKTFQVKFWVDQQVCPTCQKWMVIDVISHLKVLHVTYPQLVVEL